MISTTELSAMRATQQQTMPESVVIKYRTQTSDGMGGWTETWTIRATVAARIVRRQWTDAEQTIAARYGASYKTQITIPAGITVLETDRIETGGATYQIVGIDRHSWQTALRIDCVEATNG